MRFVSIHCYISENQVCFCASVSHIIKFNWLNTVNVSTFALYSHHNLGTANILLGGVHY